MTNAALPLARAVCFGQPVSNPLLCLRIPDTALAIEQDEMRLQIESARVQVIRTVNRIVNREPVFETVPKYVRANDVCPRGAVLHVTETWPDTLSCPDYPFSKLLWQI